MVQPHFLRQDPIFTQENLPREITVPDDALDPTARVEGPRTSQLEELSKEPPEELLCPIMHGLMTGARETKCV